MSHLERAEFTGPVFKLFGESAFPPDSINHSVMRSRHSHGLAAAYAELLRQLLVFEATGLTLILTSGSITS
jgi:hypothetical protein